MNQPIHGNYAHTQNGTYTNVYSIWMITLYFARFLFFSLPRFGLTFFMQYIQDVKLKTVLDFSLNFHQMNEQQSFRIYLFFFFLFCVLHCQREKPIIFLLIILP